MPDLRALAGDLVVDALVLGVSPVTIEQFGEWFVVAAEQDWLTRKSELSVVEAFHRIQRLPEYRQNSNRTPVVITAFAANVLVLGTEGPIVIKGCAFDVTALTTHLRSRFPGWRVVAFSTLVPLEEAPQGAAHAA